MRVKYQTRIVRKQFSTDGGTSSERIAFFRDVANALVDMGAPLNAEIFVEDTNGLDAPLIGENYGELGGAAVYITTHAQQGSTDLYMKLECYGRNNVMNNDWSNMFFGHPIKIGETNSKEAAIVIHAVKSGDSFFFGFVPSDGDSMYNACISCALTPMRRLSDPPVSLGYALVEGAIPGGPDAYVGGMLNRTLPFVEGFNYMNGMYNFTTTGCANAFPETDTGKIPLVPYFAGIEDIYYDKVYVCPMKRGIAEEKAFETDKGTFLIGGIHGVDHTTMGYNNFAFDITEAVNTAQ